MKTHLSTSIALALAALTSAITGCGDAASEGEGEDTGEQATSITARGMAVAGCGANGIFAINNLSNFNSTTDWVALDQSAFTNLTSQLSSYNNQFQQNLVSNNASEVSSTIQQAINQATNFTNAYQASQMFATQAANSANANFANTIVSHQDSTVATLDSNASQWASNAGSARNTAMAANNNSAWNRANRGLVNSNNFINSSSMFGGGFGAVAPAFGWGVGVIGAPIASMFTTQAGFNSNFANSALSNFANSNSLVASDNFTNFSNFTANNVSQHQATAAANQWTRTAAQSSRNTAATLASQSAIQNAAQAASVSRYGANSAYAQRANFVAFQNLSSLAANQLVLNVNMTAASNQAHTLRVFTLLSSFPYLFDQRGSVCSQTCDCC
jgi:hypothetical protein